MAFATLTSSLTPPPTTAPLPAPATFLDVVGLVAATGFWEARRCVDLNRETKFEFCGGGALADTACAFPAARRRCERRARASARPSAASAARRN